MTETEDWLEKMGADIYGGSEAYHAAREKSRAHHATLVPVACPWGWCTNMVDPATNKIDMGIGQIVCPCDHLRGWKSDRVAGQLCPPSQ